MHFKNIYYFVPFNIRGQWQLCEARTIMQGNFEILKEKGILSVKPQWSQCRSGFCQIFVMSATCSDNLLLYIVYAFNFWTFFKRLSYNRSWVLIAQKGKTWTHSWAKLCRCFCSMLPASCQENSPRLHQCLPPVLQHLPSPGNGGTAIALLPSMDSHAGEPRPGREAVRAFAPSRPLHCKWLIVNYLPGRKEDNWLTDPLIQC